MQREQFFHHEARIQSHNSGSTVLRQKDNKMDEASATLSWEDVKEWMEKQQPYMLQTVLKTASNLLVPYCNNSEHSASEHADIFLVHARQGGLAEWKTPRQPFFTAKT